MMKRIFVLLLFFSAVLVQAQDQKMKTTVSSFSVETNNLDELKNYDWRSLKKYFKDNDKNDSIQIKFCLKNDYPKDSKEVFKLTLSSTTIKGENHELNKMIRTAKKMIKEIIKIKKELTEE